MPKHPILRTVVLAQVCFYVSFVICVLVLPQGIQTNDGLSYYGVYRQSIVPYTLGLVLTSFLFFRLSHQLKAYCPRPFRQALAVVAGLTLFLVVTPYTYSESMYTYHTSAGVILFLTQYGVLVWLLTVMRSRLYLLMLIAATFTLLFTGFYLSAIYGYLILGQLAFQFIFMSSIYLYVRQSVDSKYYVEQ